MVSRQDPGTSEAVLTTFGVHSQFGARFFKGKSNGGRDTNMIHNLGSRKYDSFDDDDWFSATAAAAAAADQLTYTHHLGAVWHEGFVLSLSLFPSSAYHKIAKAQGTPHCNLITFSFLYATFSSMPPCHLRTPAWGVITLYPPFFAHLTYIFAIPPANNICAYTYTYMYIYVCVCVRD